MQADLVERARKGDQEAFTSLATAVFDRCYGLAYRILRDPHRAEDATQQALIGAWRDLPRLRDLDKFDHWLHRLVINACYAESRGHRRWLLRVREVELDPRVATSTPDIARSIADVDELDGAFRELSPEHRAVLVLHHYMGYPLTEVAETLGIPVGTARSRLHYAVRRMREILDAVDPSFAASAERPR